MNVHTDEGNLITEVGVPISVPDVQAGQAPIPHETYLSPRNLLARFEARFLLMGKMLGIPELDSLEVRTVMARTAFSVVAPDLGHGGCRAEHRIIAALEAMSHDDHCGKGVRPETITNYGGHALGVAIITQVKDFADGWIDENARSIPGVVGECTCGVDALSAILEPKTLTEREVQNLVSDEVVP